MKKILSICILIFLSMQNFGLYAGELSELEKSILTFGNNRCEEFPQTDIPTIFIPGILASWYSEEGFENQKIKRWIPDPITHSYDTLFYTFKQNGYDLKDVFYTDEFNTYIDGNPRQSLYLFGYDWKKDNKITAKLLGDLIFQIRKKYEQENGCDIGTVNIVGHSMGGLVARAMLEDMCANDDAIKNYYDRSNFDDGQIPDFINTKCNFTRVNKLITISTPHRGAPASFAMWEKGALGQTDGFIKSELLKRQLGLRLDKNLYKLIHGYDDKVPNGIITIGQLLPDLKKSTSFNSDLLYLEQDGKTLGKYIYPVNNFLEELNDSKNIDMLFSNISGKFISHYSTLTQNNDSKNNTIGFKLSKNYFNDFPVLILKTDNTKYSKGKDIYDKYPKEIKENIFNIEKNIRDEKGKGGDGTVPTNNLKLLPNNSFILNEKDLNFKYISDEFKCYIGNEKIFNKEKDLYKNYGTYYMEMCSHTKTPIGLAPKIFEEISDKKTKYDLEKYIGYLDYTSTKKEYITKKSIVGDVTISNNVITGISNNIKINNLFDTNYKKLFKNDSKIQKFKSGEERISLDFSGKAGQFTSLMRYEVLSPINLLIEDEMGRKIGIDPETGLIINEIPGAWTSGDTEGSREPEFFLIPRTGTGKIMHKINSFGTGDGEYHIVIEEIKTGSGDIEMGNKSRKTIIAGVAKKGIEEDYVVGVEGNKIGYLKIDSNNIDVLNELELDKKYLKIYKQIIEIINKKYDYKKKQSLKNRLEKFVKTENNKFKNDEKLNYLVKKIYEYLFELGY